MAVRIVEGALRGNISKESETAGQSITNRHRGEITALACEYAKYKNAFRISQLGYALNAAILNAPSCHRESEMTDDPSSPDSLTSDPSTSDPARPSALTPEAARKPLPAAAQRALAEAEARRRAAAAHPNPHPKELQGPKGPEPTRYGDWENKGIASDF
jgi:hypothetical protein